MSAQRQKLAVLAAGGTGGHMFPARALAEQLLGHGWRVALLTDQRGGGFGAGFEDTVETRHLRSGALAGGDFLAKAKGAFNLAIGTLQAFLYLVRRRPDAVVGFGGYASVPPVLVGGYLRCPIVLHEQNAVAGRANRFLAAKAHAIATCFEQVKGFDERESGKTVLTGNPVRPAIAALRAAPYRAPGADGPLHLLVIGGSQGATILNEAVPDAIERLPESQRHRLHIAQQVRGNGLEEIAARYAACGVTADLRSFFDDMPEQLAKAHLVIARAGASTIAELSIAGRPAILVPYPFAADDHQAANARSLSMAGGAWLLAQSNLSGPHLAERLETLLSAPETLTNAASAARSFGQERAAERLAAVVFSATGLVPDQNDSAPQTREEDAA
ncbi:undecaprenyldiphospho-muramoylpentapeptide beta-N-acetylglucosaminyltransferase [Limibacillus halophilus]|uniref:UDP-N-acetylglucosamine--N-acetylmuramyl-(pentapeptide) pyrophosphoryl-undecaprenol N-acetylglucosamine transferase n=1 Tax=Limibacillus halophilus TaxID=1579333 RepID=A0A839STW7_9PROT|nr:undecaprenyldiphospho-muramoylpentapeptide beta-N-acetylglucosaminyltransferase [Limibacillus halophilus]MBB3064846.1 UDP-N-acetylglucosamine--N-acetylmuramyl-(pentapeptide) pyrophosphoryl-undecaprenol N-acetylglucosamine transferase [Limibacillus halophilus]